MIKVGEIKVGDLVLSSDKDFLSGKTVNSEWWIVDGISPCGTLYTCRAKSDGEIGTLFIDEITVKAIK